MHTILSHLSELTVIPFLNDRFLNNLKMICLYGHGSARRLDISEPGFGMGVCGCFIAGRKCHTGKSAMVRKILIT